MPKRERCAGERLVRWQGGLGWEKTPSFPPFRLWGTALPIFMLFSKEKDVLCNREMERHSSGLPQSLLLPMRVVEMG